jgi:uncharacterized protein (DUF4415 family)
VKRSRVADAPSRGRADLRRLRAVREREIAKASPDELANLPHDFWDEADVVMPVARRAISFRVDEDVLGWFRALGPGYQTRMNAVLRSYMKRQSEARDPRGPATGGARHDFAVDRTRTRAARSAR